MDLFGKIKSFFSGNDPSSSPLSPGSSKDTFLEESVHTDQALASPNLIKDKSIENPSFIDRSRFIDHAFNLTKDIEATFNSLGGKIITGDPALSLLTESAYKIIFKSTDFISEQLPTSEYGYRPEELEKAKVSYEKRDEVLKQLRFDIDDFALQTVSTEAEEAHKVVVDQLVAFRNKVERIIESNALVSFRNYPSGNSMDTVMIQSTSTQKVSLSYLHQGFGVLFIHPREIHHVDLRTINQYSSTVKDSIGHQLQFGKTDDGRHVIQQLGMRSCGASVTNMVLLDMGLKPDIESEHITNLSNNDKLIADFTRAGASKVAERTVAYNLPWQQKLEFLTNELAKGGPLILAVGGEIGGHYIILDRIDTKTGLASIRDPYHGWAIQCSADGIAKRFGATAISFY